MPGSPNPKRPKDLDQFFSDPAFAGDKDFLTGVINRTLDERLKKEKEKREEGDESIFDFLFGGE